MTTTTVDAVPADREPIPSVPPRGWEPILPRYRVTREIHPAEKPRFRSEPPFSHMADSNRWQYAERIMQAGEVIETKEWPHPSFRPLNYSGKRTVEFFINGIRSRMARSPWQGNRLVLMDGVSSHGAPAYVAPRPQPMDLRPAS